MASFLAEWTNRNREEVADGHFVLFQHFLHNEKRQQYCWEAHNVNEAVSLLCQTGPVSEENHPRSGAEANHPGLSLKWKLDQWEVVKWTWINDAILSGITRLKQPTHFHFSSENWIGRRKKETFEKQQQRQHLKEGREKYDSVKVHNCFIDWNNLELYTGGPQKTINVAEIIRPSKAWFCKKTENSGNVSLKRRVGAGNAADRWVCRRMNLFHNLWKSAKMHVWKV